MSVDGLLLVVVAGAALLALWTDVRFPALAPSELRAALVRVIVALALGQLVPPAMVFALERGVSPAATVLTLALPALVLFFLAALWLMRVLQEAFVGARR